MAKLTQNDDDPSQHEVKNDSMSAKPNLKGDWLNFFLLMLLYTIQGVPFGFSAGALPLIMQNKKGVSYKDQAFFSFVLWPSSIKILWAPLVDAFYVPWAGRRKSWLIPTQYFMGLLMLYAAYNIDEWLPETGKPNIMALTLVFLLSNILVSTQDIVVDGFALTLLKKHNVGYSSTCSIVGFSLGMILGSVLPILFDSETFCNKYLRIIPATGGIISLEKLLYIWSVTLILITTLIIFKKEKDTRLESNNVKLSIVQNYVLLWDILKLPSIRILLIALFTLRIGFTAMKNTFSNLKLIDAGIPKEDLMVLKIGTYVVNILIPLITSKVTSGPKSMSVFLRTMPFRLLWSPMYIAIVHFTPNLINKINGITYVPIYYYLILGFVYTVNEVTTCIMAISLTAFFCRISDPRFGGTYMTLLNTITNLGSALSSTLGLRMIDVLTFKKCSNDSLNNCSRPDMKNACTANGGTCVTISDGYYVEVVLCLIIGFVWYGFFKNIIKRLEMKSPTFWYVKANTSRTKHGEESHKI